jgi:hypothetical protein
VLLEEAEREMQDWQEAQAAAKAAGTPTSDVFVSNIAASEIITDEGWCNHVSSFEKGDDCFDVLC